MTRRRYTNNNTRFATTTLPIHECNNRRGVRHTTRQQRKRQGPTTEALKGGLETDDHSTTHDTTTTRSTTTHNKTIGEPHGGKAHSHDGVTSRVGVAETPCTTKPRNNTIDLLRRTTDQVQAIHTPTTNTTHMTTTHTQHSTRRRTSRHNKHDHDEGNDQRDTTSSRTRRSQPRQGRPTTSTTTTAATREHDGHEHNADDGHWRCSTSRGTTTTTSGRRARQGSPQHD